MGAYNDEFDESKLKNSKILSYKNSDPKQIFTEVLLFFPQQGETSKQKKIVHGNLVKKLKAINQTPELCS